MLCSRKSRVCVCAMAAVLMIFSSAVQAEIIAPVSATASSTFSGPWGIGNVIDGSGMTSGKGVAITGAPWPASVPNADYGSYVDPVSSVVGPQYEWFTNNTTVGTATFDLGADKNLASTHVWNCNTETNQGRSIKDVVISVASEAAPTTWTAVYTGQFDKATGAGDTGKDYILTGASNARYVQFAFSSNYGGAGDYTGLAQVRFESVPEPSAIVLLVTGLIGLMAYAWRKRR